MSARSDTFTNRGVKILKLFFNSTFCIFDIQIGIGPISGNMNIGNIEVSLYPSECALFKYAIEHTFY